MRTTRSANEAERAIDAAADKLLSDERARRIDKAEAQLSGAKQRLTNAEIAHECAAADLARNEWDGSRKAMLGAESELVLARALAERAERGLSEAKKRTGPEARAHALVQVRGERRFAAVAQERDQVVADVTRAATELIQQVHRLRVNFAQLASTRSQIQSAREAFGHQTHDADLHVADPRQVAANAILAACRSERFPAGDWRELGRIVADIAFGAQQTAEGERRLTVAAHVDEEADSTQEVAETHVRQQEPAWPPTSSPLGFDRRITDDL